MKHTRQDRVWIAGGSTGGLFVDAVILGDWFVAKNGQYFYTLSHASGLAARQRLGPVQAAHLLRRIQAVPPCPLSTDEMRRVFRGESIKGKKTALKIWKWHVKAVLDTVPLMEWQR